ncbi:trichohyalin-like isoform X1 [Varroa jacobsoni]|nr:trichohyalin-like isoform X1 [Varroa jacobsoni]
MKFGDVSQLCGEKRRLHVPISEETNQEDDATSQITQADDRDIDTSQTPTQQKQEKRESQQEELRKLQMELEQLEIRAVQLDKEEDHLRTIIKEENKLKKEIEELQADVYRIEKEKDTVMERGRLLKDQAKLLGKESMSKRAECEQLEMKIQQTQTEHLMTMCTLHVKSTRDLRIALSRSQGAVHLFDSKLLSPRELQDRIEKTRNETTSYNELIERTTNVMDRLENSECDHFILEQQEGKDLLNFFRIVKEVYVKELSALDQAAGRFAKCAELKILRK